MHRILPTAFVLPAAVILTAATLGQTASVASTAPAQPAPSAALNAVQTHLRAVATMTADFVQTDRAGKALAGKLTLKRPGRVRFQYQSGVPILIVGDGKALIFVDYSVAQVQRWPIGNSPLAVLLDPARALGGFVRILPSGDNRILLAEARDPRRPEYGTLTLAFARDPAAPGGLRLQGWVALDAQNNRTSVRLSNQRFNEIIGDEAFRWRDPRSARGPR